MNLLFVGYLHGFGGAEKMIVELANAMAERSHTVHLISLVADSHKYPLSSKVDFKFIPDQGSNKVVITFNRFINLRNIVKIINPDLSIHFWLQSAYMCAFMSKDIAKRTIYSERGDPSDREYSGILGVIRKLAFRRMRAFVFQSKGAAEYFNDKVQSRSAIIHNPVSLNKDDFPNIGEREKRIVTVGRLHPQKNQELLIRAFSRLPESKNEYKLEIYGDGELREYLQHLIKNMGLSERIKLMGTFKEVHAKIYKAALFVLSSNYEGMPNALLEAMVLGIPCISTDCKPGGVRELIENEVNGIIVPSNNADIIAKKIDEILSSPDTAKNLAIQAMKIHDAFKPEIIYSNWERFFEDLCNKNKEV